MRQPIDPQDRERLAELAGALRDATIDAIRRRSVLARSLDEARLELERLLMMPSQERREARGIVIRAQMVLDVWRATAAAAASSR